MYCNIFQSDFNFFSKDKKKVITIIKKNNKQVLTIEIWMEKYFKDTVNDVMSL